MDSVMKRLMGQCSQNFWSRTAPEVNSAFRPSGVGKPSIGMSGWG